jgi:hypothetical protein
MWHCDPGVNTGLAVAASINDRKDDARPDWTGSDKGENHGF